VFYLNAWLEQKGYLKVADPDNGRSIVDVAESVTDALGISEQVGRLLPEPIRERVGSGRRLLDAGNYEDRIDFAASRAVALPQGPVYVLDHDPEFCDQLAAELRTVTDPESGRRVLMRFSSPRTSMARRFARMPPTCLSAGTTGSK